MKIPLSYLCHIASLKKNPLGETDLELPFFVNIISNIIEINITIGKYKTFRKLRQQSVLNKIVINYGHRHM